MKQSAYSTLQGEEGSALLELALVMPVFLLVLFGILQCSLALFAYGNITFAGRAAVRYASLHSAASSVPASAASIRAIVAPYVWCAPASSVKITPSWSPANGVGSTVQVLVTMDLPLTIPFSQTTSFTISTTAKRMIVR